MQFVDQVEDHYTKMMGAYQYDDGFQRLWKVDRSISPDEIHTVYIYSPEGELISEVEWIEAPYKKVENDTDKAYSEEAIKYQFTDHLGTTRYTVGMTWHTPDSWFDPYTLESTESPSNMTPYGAFLAPQAQDLEELALWNETLLRIDPAQFTGKSRDVESRLDYFGARYYSNQISRWMSVDPLIIQKGNTKIPQKWNLFSYVRSNPLIYFDPHGMADDKLTSNPKVKIFMLYMLERSGYSRTVGEWSSAIRIDPKTKRVRNGKIINAHGESKVNIFLFPGAEAIIHTHATESSLKVSPKTSTGADAKVAEKTKLPVYAISVQGIWKVLPGSSEPIFVRGPDWVEEAIKLKEQEEKEKQEQINKQNASSDKEKKKSQNQDKPPREKDDQSEGGQK